MIFPSFSRIFDREKEEKEKKSLMKKMKGPRIKIDNTDIPWDWKGDKMQEIMRHCLQENGIVLFQSKTNIKIQAINE